MHGWKKALRGVIVGSILIAAGLAVLLLTGVIRLPGRDTAAAAANGSAKRGAPPVAVTTAPVTTRAVQRRVTMVGNLLGQEEVTVTPKVEGRVLKIHFDIGDTVRPGDTLLEIEDIDHRLAETESLRALELELAKLGLKELPTGELDVRQLPTVVRARTVEENAQLKLVRAQRLRDTRSSAAEEFDQANADYNVAKAMKDQAVMEAQATLAAARHKHAMLETARQRLSETRVQVPLPSGERYKASGASSAHILPISVTEPKVEYVVAQRLVSEGEMVRVFPSVAAFRLVIDRPLKLVAPIPERHVGEVKVGQPVGMIVEAYPNEIFKGTVARVNPTVDRTSRTFLIEVHVPNESRRLRPGSFAKAAALTREDQGALTVPEEAVVSFAGVNKVFVVTDSKARAVPVKLGERLAATGDSLASNWVEVTGTLRAGDPVVTSGHSQLSEGTLVRGRGAGGEDRAHLSKP